MKRIHPPVISFMLSFVMQENSATFSPPECFTVFASLDVTIDIVHPDPVIVILSGSSQ